MLWFAPRAITRIIVSKSIANKSRGNMMSGEDTSICISTIAYADGEIHCTVLVFDIHVRVIWDGFHSLNQPTMLWIAPQESARILATIFLKYGKREKQ